MKAKLSHMRLVLPCLLVAVLVLDGLMGYTAPDPFDGLEVVTTKAYAAEAPELEIMEQTAEKQTGKGPAGKLGKVAESGDYADGTYTGSARGFGGKIKVEVTIREGKIAGVRILSASGETGSYLSRAKSVIRRIVSGNSTNVDAVSGATYSSNGIIKAVRNALSKAKKNKSKTAEKSEEEQSPDENREPVRPETVTGGVWNDGVYTGEGEGFSGILHVQVTITEGQIASVELTDTLDDEEFMSRAREGIFESVLSSQGTDVDAVTGATFSSYGLVEAINDALRKAVSDNTDTGEETGGSTSDDSGTDPEPVTETVTKTNWVYYDEDEDFEDYQLTVTFTLTDGKIVNISDYSQDGHVSNGSYIRSAVRGINDQLSSGVSAESVDSVTGATCTSTAIKEMIRGVSAGKRTSPDGTEDENKNKNNDAVIAAEPQYASAAELVLPEETGKDAAYIDKSEETVDTQAEPAAEESEPQTEPASEASAAQAEEISEKPAEISEKPAAQAAPVKEEPKKTEPPAAEPKKETPAPASPPENTGEDNKE